MLDSLVTVRVNTKLASLLKQSNRTENLSDCYKQQL